MSSNHPSEPVKSLVRFILFGFLATLTAFILTQAANIWIAASDGVPVAIIWAACLLAGGIAGWAWRVWSRRKKARNRREQEQSGARPEDAQTAWHMKILGVAAGICLAIGLYFALVYLFFLFAGIPLNAGPFDRTQMESLVAQVRHEKFSDRKAFTWMMISGKATLSPITTNGYHGNYLWAEYTEDQKLTVVIMTRDGGHVTSYGFEYSDTPLTSADDPEGQWQPKKQIDAHWWEVYDNDE